MPWEIIKWCILAIVLLFAATALTGAPYVPSRRRELKLLFKNLYKIGPKDFLVDLGSGDGVVLKAAGEQGASGLGIELNPFLVAIAKIRLCKYKNLAVRCGNLFKLEFPKETTVVYIFGDGRDIEKMFSVVQNQADKLKKDLFIISHGFKSSHRKPIKKYRAYFLYKISHN